MSEATQPDVAGEVEPKVRHQAVVATWGLELTCHCPACDEYVDLLHHPDFWDGRHDMQACERGTPSTTGMEVVCPNCGAEFTVDCQY